MTEEYREYKPFEGGMPYQVYQEHGYKCEYCGKPNYHANCHAHKEWCPYYCDNNPSELGLGDGIGILIAIAFSYFAYKLFTKKVNKL